MHSAVALQLRDIRARFGSVLAVDGLTMSVRRGEIVALTGPNGSGKSTTLAIAAGILDPASGQVEIEGVQRAVDPLRYARLVGVVPQDFSLYDDFTAVQNLEFFGRLYGLRGYELDARIGRALVRSRLSDRANDRVRTYSGGMRQRLGIATSLLHDPTVVLLDEPTAALDVASREDLFAELHRLRDDGHAILLTTHHGDEAERACDRLLTLNHGQLATEPGSTPGARSRRQSPSTLFGHLSDDLPRYLERRIRKRLPAGVQWELTGRRVRLTAATSEELGRALAVLLGEGACLSAYRSAVERRQPIREAS